MDTLTKTSKVIKGIETRKDYDQLIAIKKKGVEKQTGRREKRGKKDDKKTGNSVKSSSCLSVFWTVISFPFVLIGHLFKCTCLRNVNEKRSRLIKSIIGFVVGVGLAWIYFLFVDNILETSRRYTIISSVVILIILAFGLAFSDYVRLITLISIPTICSSSGRTILIMIIFIQIFKGPVVNTAYNLNQIGSSISCASDVVKGSNSNKTYSEILSEKSKEIFNRVLQPIKDYNAKLAVTVAAITTSAANLISKVRKIKKIYDKFNLKCEKILKKIKISCDKIDSKKWFKRGLCWVMDLFGTLNKYNQKVQLERFCSPYVLIARKLGQYLFASTIVVTLNSLRDDLYFEIEPNYNYTYTYGQSISSKEVLIRVKDDMTPLFRWMSFFVIVITYLSPLASLLILIRSHFYRSKYLSIDHYDNIYLTSYVYDIDRKRYQTNISMDQQRHRKSGIGRIPSLENGFQSKREETLETIFPLSKSERRRFIEPTDLSYSKFESRRFWISIIFFLFTIFVVVTYILLDYILYWTLSLIAGLKENVDINYNRDNEGGLVLNVKGEGDLASAYQEINGVTSTIKSESQLVATNVWTCWPEPSVPDYDIYRLIRLLLIICFIMIIIEAWTLRLRHVFCDYYYPGRAKIRAVWLYNQIIQSRSSFARSIFSYFHSDKTKSNMKRTSFCDKFIQCCPCIRYLKDVCGYKNIYCSNCGIQGSYKRSDEHADQDKDTFRRCESTTNCDGIYCTKCLVRIENVCIICNNPVTYLEYDDADDSEEVDSSEDEDARFDGDNDSNLDVDDVMTRNKLQKFVRRFVRFGKEKQHSYTPINEHEDYVDDIRTQDEIYATIRDETGVPPEEMKLMSDKARKGMV